MRISILKQIFFLLILVLEFISYQYNFIYSLNLFIGLWCWFNLVYWYFGLTEKENKLKYPIKFRFTLVYFYLVFIRYIKVKYLLIKDLFTSKNISIKGLLKLLVVVGISLILVRYVRSILFIEIIQALNLDKYYYEFISMIGIIISAVIIDIYKEIIKLFYNDFMFNYLTNDKTEI